MSLSQVLQRSFQRARLGREAELSLAHEHFKGIGKRQAAATFVPASIVAGSVNVAAGADPAQVAYNSACLALDSERVCLIFSAQGRLVHYIAGLASDFSSSSPNVTTILAIGLPGMPHHQGEGCYRVNVGPGGDLIACVACKDGRVYSFVGAPSRAERFPAAIGGVDIPVIDLSASDERVQDIPVWKPHSEREREDNKRLLRYSAIFLFAVNCVMAMIWIASAISQGVAEGKLHSIAEEAKLSMSSLIVKLAPAAYKHEAWNEYQSVAAFAMDHKGRLDHFELKDGKLTWRISVPAFVTGGEINSTFKGISVTQDGDNLIIRKGG